MNAIKLNYQQISQISDEDLKTISSQLSAYSDHLRSVMQNGGYGEDEASINLPSDIFYHNQIKELGAKFKSERLKYIIVIGIGGSNLGTMAIYNALRGLLGQLKSTYPKIIFVETVSTKFYEDLLQVLEGVSSDEILVNVISKSGGTTETVSIFETLIKYLESKVGKMKDRIVVTSDEGSKLFNAAISLDLPVLSIPAKVGGRFSVFSSVGMFPLYVAGFNVDRIWEGAANMEDEMLKGGENLSLISAALIYLHKQKGISINNNFFFNIELEYIGRWYRQLMGESIGKEKDIEGNTVHQGITPIVSIGSTDLHSMAQLYIGGPNDIFTQFVYHHEDSILANVPENLSMPGLVSSIEGKNFGTIMDAILNGVKTAYSNAGIAYSEVILEGLDEYTLGAYLQFKMIEMMYLGKLLGVNTFDQPNVEDYKKVTRTLLAE